jgi:Fur family transcriptional regulator, ferric uptake regulator
MRTSSVDLIILELLEKEDQHLTSQQIFEEIRGRLPAVNPSTVYRSLERLSGQGKISVSDMGFGAAVYERVSDGLHHHLVCVRCGHIHTIGHAEVNHFFEAVQQSHNFEIATNHLILFGSCEACKGAA